MGAAHDDGRTPAARFYEYHAAMMEPWDGPAAMVFTDGKNRSGADARPQWPAHPTRYIVTEDDLVVGASESGRAADPREQDPQEVASASRARCCSSTWSQGRIVEDEELKNQFRVSQKPVPAVDREACASSSKACRPARPRLAPHRESLLDRQQAFGYTQEDLKFLLSPMALSGEEGIGSMGNDSPLAVLSDKNKAALQTTSSSSSRRSTNPADRSDFAKRS